MCVWDNRGTEDRNVDLWAKGESKGVRGFHWQWGATHALTSCAAPLRSPLNINRLCFFVSTQAQMGLYAFVRVGGKYIRCRSFFFFLFLNTTRGAAARGVYFPVFFIFEGAWPCQGMHIESTNEKAPCLLWIYQPFATSACLHLCTPPLKLISTPGRAGPRSSIHLQALAARGFFNQNEPQAWSKIVEEITLIYKIWPPSPPRFPGITS